MLPRTWDIETLLRSIPWMPHQNLNGRNVYIRLRGEHNLTLVDDLSAAGVAAMKRKGFLPSLVVRTSPGDQFFGRDLWSGGLVLAKPSQTPANTKRN